MLSICIPIYNVDITALVHDLRNEAESLDIDYQILLIDDASEDWIKDKNKVVSKLSNIDYKELQENSGRSSIRNLLAREARYPFLLFMDCDAQIYKPHFLKNYLPYCTPNSVCCGGLVYTKERPHSSYYLRWLVGTNREEIKLEYRRAYPHGRFTAFNFLINKAILLDTPFDLHLDKYGHEDTLLGIELLKKGINITHIDNPLLHTGLDTACDFIKKTEESIANIVQIEAKTDNEQLFISSIKLLRTYYKLESLHLAKLSASLFSSYNKFLLSNLLGKTPKLFLFDLYKLGYICVLKTKKASN